MKKIGIIFGTRPELIKLLPIIYQIYENKNFELFTVNTGQHKEMINSVLEDYPCRIDYTLDVMSKSTNLAEILTTTIEGLNPIVVAEQPDLIIVHGDTSATLAGSLVALYNQVKIAHVEAGLRTNNKYSPFPEEANRQLVGRIADYHFAPTEKTRENLLKENVLPENIYVVGNTSIDMVHHSLQADYTSPILDWVGDSRMVIITTHRRENSGQFEAIFLAINKLAEDLEDVKFIFPIHLNPAIRKIALKMLTSKNIKIIEPLNTLNFHNTMRFASLILTDSGGIQEEAPILDVPVFVLRDNTERPEGVDANTLRLIGTDPQNIYDQVISILSNKAEHDAMCNGINPYGDGTSAKQIHSILTDILN